MSTNSINMGSQILTFDYRQPASSKLFNRGYSDLLPYGIYRGGQVSRVNDTQISIDPLVCLIKSNELLANNISVRVETTVPQELSLAVSIGSSYANPARPYVVLRFGWADVEANYMEFKAVAYSADPGESRPDYLWKDDLIVGRILFTDVGGGNFIVRDTSFVDYTRRHTVFIPQQSSIYAEYVVSASENNPRKVYVSGGVVNTSKGQFVTPGGDYPTSGTIPDTSAQGRYDLVWVDDTGIIRIEQGVASATPVSPIYRNRRVLAEIRRGPNRTNIEGPDIFLVNDPGRQGTISAEDFPIKDADNYFPTDTIEAAFKALHERFLSILAGPGISDGSVKDYHINWGHGASQVNAEDVPVQNSLVAATNVDTAISELAGVGRTTETLKNLKDYADSISNALNTLGNSFVNHVDTLVDDTVVHGINIVNNITL